MSAIEEVLVQRQGDGDVRAGLELNVEVSLAGERRRARIDHDERRASLARFLDEGHEVDARGRRVHAPEDDEAGVHVVFVGDARHLSVETHVGGAGRCRAHRAREPRRAERPPQRGIVGVLREQAIRPAIAERQDGLATRAISDGGHALGDLVECFVPADAREDAVALSPLADGGVEEAVFAVDALRKATDFAADVAARARVLVAAVDLDDAPLLDGDLERAGVRAVERTRALDGRVSPGFRLLCARHMR